jgi:hypothetical protein
MGEPRNSNQPDPTPEELRAKPRCGCPRGCNAPFQTPAECALHCPDIPPMPSTVHNVHNQGRVIE